MSTCPTGMSLLHNKFSSVRSSNALLILASWDFIRFVVDFAWLCAHSVGWLILTVVFSSPYVCSIVRFMRKLWPENIKVGRGSGV